MQEPDPLEPESINPEPTEPFTDDEASWVYWTPLDKKETGVPDEWVWERLRFCRDALLNASDFRMVSDAPWNQTEWETYRQALRDLPGKTIDPRKTVWPTPPV